LLFPTTTFALFFLLVFPISWWLRPPSRAWKGFILGASYVFYGYWDWRFVLLIVASTVVNAAVAKGIARGGSRLAKTFLTVAVAFNLAVLGLFKYYGFFLDSLERLLGLFGRSSGLPFLEIILPVGISFFTFQFLSYVVDVYRRVVPPAPLLDVAVYPAFFPHIVAGPIVRASEFLPQLAAPLRITRHDVTRAGLLIAQGAFKKVVVSTYLATAIVDPVFAAPEAHSALACLLAIYGYAVQIYADFSGYTDMAIGIALLLGIRFPDNFDRPYAAASIQDFWRRWHMTLSRWLQDYLYTPLARALLRRQPVPRHWVNQLVPPVATMLLGGLWHGAAATFVAWGAYHGLGLAVERWWSRRPGRPAAPAGQAAGGAVPGQSSLARRWAGRLFTFHFVCLGWVLFRAESFGAAGRLLARVATAPAEALEATAGAAPEAAVAVALTIAAMLALQVVPRGWEPRWQGTFARLPLAAQGLAIGAFFGLTVALGPKGVLPFIYFRF